MNDIKRWRTFALVATMAALPACAHAIGPDVRTCAERPDAFDLITGAYELPTAAPTPISTTAALASAAPMDASGAAPAQPTPDAPALPSGIIASAAGSGVNLPYGDVTAGEFSLMILVNRDNPMPEGLEPVLVDIGGGDSVDARCYDDLMLMLADCRAAGLEPVICSAYRTQDYQVQLYENKIDRLLDEGVTAELAPALAMTVVALPGTSEHQLGLALDIVDASYQQLDEAQEHTEVQRWLMENSYRYGFILRYPNDKSAVTGIIYEPWHYRYVGRAAAQQIYESGLCLEEFLEAYPAAVG